MDNELSDNDPYRNMNTAQDDVRPEFLNRVGGKKGAKEKVAQGALKAAEVVAASKGVPVGGAKGLANSNDTRDAEQTPAGFFTGKGKSQFMGKKGKFKLGKLSIAVVLVFGLVMAVAAVSFIGGPLFMIGNIDYNLQDALGFTGTVGILEKQAEYVTGEEMARGRVPDALAADFAKHGLMVGQVTANGDFVRTNVYVADADELKDLAVLGNYQTQPSDGALAILFEDKVINAEDFVAAVESNPKMYAAYSEALDIAAKYYYSDEVDNVYQEMGITRGAFSEWVDTGDEEKNQESFNEKLEEMLNKNSDLNVGGYSGSTGNTDADADADASTNTSEENGQQISGMSSATEIISDVASDVQGNGADDANSRAAQLLNTAISASEPYLAASAFIAIEEPIQRARIEGNGPVNEIMNLMNAESEVSYTDVKTGEDKTIKQSILTTPNFVAAVSAGEFSKAEAVNFSRDRSLVAMKVNDYGVINDTAISTNGQKESNIGIRSFFGNEASVDALNVLNDSVDMALIEENNKLMRSVVGGNRIVEGGSFISNSLNKRVLGAMPSGAEQIAAYHREVKEVIARKAEAERATKSPFDISSPYTFMGSLARGLANATIRNRAKTGVQVNAAVGAIADLTNGSINSLWGQVLADGDDKSYAMTFGDYCDTVLSTDTEADIYCTAHTTISTGYMKKDIDDWSSSLGSNLDGGGQINSDSDLGRFVSAGMDRRATVGVQSPDSCNAYNNAGGGGFISGLLRGIGLFGPCDGVDDGVATGSKYTNGGSGDTDEVRLFGGFVLYDTVSSLMEGSVSKVSAYKERYYKEHPLDNSRAGQIARISGLTKDEARIALAYADYLTMVANYNPATRYAFGGVLVEKPEQPLVEHSGQVAVDLYVMWQGQTEYDDLRGRIRVV